MNQMPDSCENFNPTLNCSTGNSDFTLFVTSLRGRDRTKALFVPIYLELLPDKI